MRGMPVGGYGVALKAEQGWIYNLQDRRLSRNVTTSSVSISDVFARHSANSTFTRSATAVDSGFAKNVSLIVLLRYCKISVCYQWKAAQVTASCVCMACCQGKTLVVALLQLPNSSNHPPSARNRYMSYKPTITNSSATLHCWQGLWL